MLPGRRDAAPALCFPLVFASKPLFRGVVDFVSVNTYVESEGNSISQPTRISGRRRCEEELMSEECHMSFNEIKDTIMSMDTDDQRRLITEVVPQMWDRACEDRSCALNERNWWTGTLSGHTMGCSWAASEAEVDH